MNSILKYGLSSLLVASSAIFMSSCNDDDTKEVISAIYPSSVSMHLPTDLQQYIYVDNTGANVLPLVKGESVTLDYSIAPDNVTFSDVEWSSNNEPVATVDDKGTVSAISGDGLGYAIIQVAPSAFYSGSGIYAVLKVSVANELVSAQSITLSSPSNEVYAGETLQLTATILPENATYKTIKWSSSNENIATVDMNGLVTGKINDAIRANVTINATSLDGAQVIASKEITVNQIVAPENVTIDQTYSLANGYLCAIADKKVVLDYTTVPADCTKSLINWTSSDESIATVSGGVVTFNQAGIFGDVTITATCPETSNTSTITLRLEEGLVRELYHDQNNYTWYNATQSGNGTTSSHIWEYGKVTVTTYTQNATNQRGDFKCWSSKTWLHAGNYPIIAIRMDDVKDKYSEVTSRNITLDASGSCAGTNYSGGLDGNNNKWLHDYQCSDGSHVFIYDMTTQKWANGGLLPTNAVAEFSTLQFKYADIRTITYQIQYSVYWVQTFKTIDDVVKYIESEGLTYDVIK